MLGYSLLCARISGAVMLKAHTVLFVLEYISYAVASGT